MHLRRWRIVFTKIDFLVIIWTRKGIPVSTHAAINSDDGHFFTTLDRLDHGDNISLDGLEHIFNWAAEVVSDGEDARVKQARERRVRREVLEVVQRYQQQRLAAKNREEISYLQRRVIALLQKVQELTEENAAVKQVMVSQFFTLQRIPELQQEINSLKRLEFEREAAVQERRVLMDALAKLKVERDFLEDTLVSAEIENERLANILTRTNNELIELKNRRWWHAIVNWLKRAYQKTFKN